MVIYFIVVATRKWKRNQGSIQGAATEGHACVSSQSNVWSDLFRRVKKFDADWTADKDVLLAENVCNADEELHERDEEQHEADFRMGFGEKTGVHGVDSVPMVVDVWNTRSGFSDGRTNDETFTPERRVRTVFLYFVRTLVVSSGSFSMVICLDTAHRWMCWLGRLLPTRPLAGGIDRTVSMHESGFVKVCIFLGSMELCNEVKVDNFLVGKGGCLPLVWPSLLLRWLIVPKFKLRVSVTAVLAELVSCA
jgi:hypothetical protein